VLIICFFLLFFVATPPLIYALSLHDALPIFVSRDFNFSFHINIVPKKIQLSRIISQIVNRNRKSFYFQRNLVCFGSGFGSDFFRSEEHTSELQSREKLVCRLLLEKKKTQDMR